MGKAVDIFQRVRQLIPFRELFIPPMFLRNKFFSKGGFNHPTTKIELDKVYDDNTKASYTIRGTEATLVGKDGYDTPDFIPPYINEKIAFDFEDLTKRLAGETPYGEKLSPDMVTVQMMLQYWQKLTKRAKVAEECQCAEAMFTGKVVGEDGRIIDFNVPADHIDNAGVNWDQNNAKPLDDIVPFMERNALDSGNQSDILLANGNTIQYLINNTDIKDKLETRRIVLGAIDPKYYSKLKAIWYGDLKTHHGEIELWAYNGSYKNDNGKNTYYIPDGKVFIGSSVARFETHYAAILAGSKIIVGERYKDTFSKKDPDIDFIRLQSSPLMLPIESKSYSILTVL